MTRESGAGERVFEHQIACVGARDTKRSCSILCWFQSGLHTAAATLTQVALARIATLRCKMSAKELVCLGPRRYIPTQGWPQASTRLEHFCVQLIMSCSNLSLH